VQQRLSTIHAERARHTRRLNVRHLKFSRGITCLANTLFAELPLLLNMVEDYKGIRKKRFLSSDTALCHSVSGRAISLELRGFHSSDLETQAPTNFAHPLTLTLALTLLRRQLQKAV
jgi:hypothetical protein